MHAWLCNFFTYNSTTVTVSPDRLTMKWCYMKSPLWGIHLQAKDITDVTFWGGRCT